MPKINYLDFDLLFERSQQGYAARVLSSPAGQATSDFSLPFSDLEIENFLLRVGRTRRGVRRLESPEMEAAKTFGGGLFEAVFNDEVRGCLRSSLDEANRKEVGLRIRLRLSDTPELADLPWEYLYNPTLNRFLVLSSGTPLVRYLDLPERIRPLTIKPPLSVLVMISSPSDYPGLDVEEEWTKLKEALGDLEQRGLVALERLEEATLANLQRRLRRGQYHIFHFVGHGAFNEQAQDGVLLLEDDEGRGRAVSGQYLGTLMHDERTLRLAILNACEGARTSLSDPFAGAAQSLVQQGIPAVIAMQFEITDEAAIALAHEFYAALADGYPVDAALAEARKAIFAQGNDVEWGTPVLYLRAPDGRIFDVERVSDEERKGAQAATLYNQAQMAMVKEDWGTALEKLQAVLALEPTHADAKAQLGQARRGQELATLYAKGCGYYRAGRWQEALGYLRRVQQMQADYKDVNHLVATAEREMTRETAVPAPRPAPSPSQSQSESSNWLWVAIPTLFVLLLLVCVGGYAANRFFPSLFVRPTPVVPVAAPGQTPTPPTPTRLPTMTPLPPVAAPGQTPTPTPTRLPTVTPTPRRPMVVVTDEPTRTRTPTLTPTPLPAEQPILYLGMFLLPDDEAERLEQAIESAVPWTDLNQAFFPDRTVVFDRPVRGTLDPNQVEYDPERAQAILDETGLRGYPLRILVVSDYEEVLVMADAMAAHLSNVGFSVIDLVWVSADDGAAIIDESLNAGEMVLVVEQW